MELPDIKRSILLKEKALQQLKTSSIMDKDKLVRERTKELEKLRAELEKSQ